MPAKQRTATVSKKKHKQAIGGSHAFPLPSIAVVGQTPEACCLHAISCPGMLRRIMLARKNETSNGEKKRRQAAHRVANTHGCTRTAVTLGVLPPWQQQPVNCVVVP